MRHGGRGHVKGKYYYYKAIYLSKYVIHRLYSQFTTSIIRLLTDGGTPLDAMHRYAPM